MALPLTSQVRNIVVVGNGSVGKTSLLLAMTQGVFQETYVATVYDTEDVVIVIDETEYQFKLHDTAGQEDYERLRRFSYHTADVFVLCYSVTDRVSFDNIELKWLDELFYEKPDIPIVLVGTKEDARTRHSVTREEGVALSKRMKTSAFFECSAKTGKNVDEVFTEAGRAAIFGSSKRKQFNWPKWISSCCCK